MSDAEELDVEWFDPHNTPQGEAKLTVYSNLNGYVNAVADRRWFEGCDQFDLGVVPDEDLIVFRSDDDGRYRFCREGSAGADVSITAALKRHWPELSLEETARVPMRQRGDLVVADLAPLLSGTESVSAGSHTEGDKSTDAAGEEEDDSTTVCPDCGNEFKNEGGLNIHLGQTDCWLGDEPTEDAEPGHDDAAVPKPDDAPSLETVRDCAKQVDTLPELADLLDVTDGEARLLARQADVYDDLEEEVAPMGAGGQ
jgi:hypothetical protein